MVVLFGRYITASCDPLPPSGVRDADTKLFDVAGSYWPPPPPDASCDPRVPRPPVTSTDDVSGMRVCQPGSDSMSARILPMLFAAYHCVEITPGADDGHCHSASSPRLNPRAPEVT